LVLLAVVSCTLHWPITDALDTSRCIGPLGMESGDIHDKDVSASSSFDGASVGPHNARVRVERNGGAWCPRQQATHQPKDWLEIDLLSDHVVTGVETQGRFGNGQGVEYAEHFLLEYWRDSLAKWVRYKDAKGQEVMDGNSNVYVAEKRDLDPVLIARRLRFFPYSHHRRTVCMRVEVYGCLWSEGISSYSMPQGDQRGSGWQFYDATYDGIWDGSLLSQGLGQLTDGKLGPDNFKAYYDQDRGWVGWRNDSHNGQPIEIVFEFDSVRDFTSLSIFANNQFTRDIQIFGEMQVHFSIGGSIYSGDPIVMRPPEDRIFENSRNVSAKLHHRVGKFVKLRLAFAAKWILISEVSFRSETSSRNYTPEDGVGIGVGIGSGSESVSVATPPSTSSMGTPPVSLPLPPGHDIWTQPDERLAPNENKNSSSNSESQQAYLAIIIGVLVAVSVLLAAAIFFMIVRHRQRKSLGGSPLPDKSGWTTGAKLQTTSLLDHEHQHQQPQQHQQQHQQHQLLHSSPKSKMYSPSTYGGSVAAAADAVATAHLLNNVVKTEYQEPYHALQFSPYYSYSTLLLAGSEGHPKSVNNPSAVSDTYDYAVPDISRAPLMTSQPLKLPATSPPLPLMIEIDTSLSSSSGSSSRKSKGSQHYVESPIKKPIDRAELLAELKTRSELLAIAEVPRNKLHLIERVANGAFGTVYQAEVDGVPEYGAGVAHYGTGVVHPPAARRLVAAKYLPNTSEKDKAGFYQEVRLLAALNDPHLSRVLGVCTAEEPFCVLLEYLEFGDLHQFLKVHRFQASPADQSSGSRTNVSKNLIPDDCLTMGSLIFIAGQIASGMRYLESLNFVHRDLAARNCLVGKGLQVKICDFGTDNETYSLDYYRFDEQLLGLPVRWMAWESVIQGKYTTKSDVWSFGVTLWEILMLARQRPFDELDDQGVVENLHLYSQGATSASLASSLGRPAHCPRDIYDLMCECWRRLPTERPFFREIHLFLQRKNLGFSPSANC